MNRRKFITTSLLALPCILVLALPKLIPTKITADFIVNNIISKLNYQPAPMGTLDVVFWVDGIHEKIQSVVPIINKKNIKWLYQVENNIKGFEWDYMVYYDMNDIITYQGNVWGRLSMVDLICKDHFPSYINDINGVRYTAWQDFI